MTSFSSESVLMNQASYIDCVEQLVSIADNKDPFLSGSDGVGERLEEFVVTGELSGEEATQLRLRFINLISIAEEARSDIENLRCSRRRQLVDFLKSNLNTSLVIDGDIDGMDSAQYLQRLRQQIETFPRKIEEPRPAFDDSFDGEEVSVECTL
ncbi:MAG: hypothetical protein ABII07_02145 [Patescibacteria group bacterium]|nr:hypothetical protein [Patescibacteria group bacterium]